MRTPEEAKKHKARMTKLRKAGLVPKDSVDAAPARSHLRWLHDEKKMSLRQVSQESGVSEPTLCELLKGRSGGRYKGPVLTHSRKTRNAIMSVQGEEPDGRGARVDATGQRRRLEALQYVGFPCTWIGLQIGCAASGKNGYVTAIMERTWTHYDLSERVREVFEKYENVKPEDLGVSTAACLSRVRNNARRKGYAPPTCWDTDTIDDPDAQPEWTGRCGTWQGYLLHKQHDIPVCAACNQARKGGAPMGSTARANMQRIDYDELIRLTREGLNSRQVAEKIGCNRDHVQVILRKLRKEGRLEEARR